MKYRNIGWSAGLITLLVSACVPSIEQLPTWNPDLLAPIVIARAEVEDLSNLENIVLTQKIPATDLDASYLPNTTVLVPPTTFGSIGPYPVEVNSAVVEIEVDSMSVLVEFENNLPFDIKSGAKLVLRNDPSTTSSSNIVFQHTIQNDVNPGETYSFFAIVQNQHVNSDLYIYMDDVATNGGNSTFGNEDSELRFTLKFLSVNRVTFKPNESYTSRDTTSISVGNGEDVDPEAAVGEIRAYFDNTLPINFRFQIYLLNAQDQLIDSLFSDRVIINAAVTDGAGNATTMSSTSDTIFIDPQRIQSLQQAESSVFDYRVFTGSGGQKVANGNSALQIQLVGDLKLKINLNN